MGPPSLSVLPQGPGVEVHLDLLQSSSGSEKGMWWVDCAVLKAAISPKDALSLVPRKLYLLNTVPHTDLGRSPSALLTFTEGRATDTLGPPRAVGGLKEDAY